VISLARGSPLAETNFALTERDLKRDYVMNLNERSQQINAMFVDAGEIECVDGQFFTVAYTHIESGKKVVLGFEYHANGNLRASINLCDELLDQLPVLNAAEMMYHLLPRSIYACDQLLNALDD
jgi:hypothetical protein